MFYDTSEDGGAQYVGRNNIFENCIFENSVTVIDFDVYNQVSTVDSNAFINCTISGGDYLFNVSRPNNTNKMVNCIVTGIQNYKKGSSTLNFTYTYTDFWNNTFATPAGTGNSSLNPLFVDAVNGNYQLKTGSPCINAGTSTGAPAFDFNGTARPQGAGYDIGAYEYSITTGIPDSEIGFKSVNVFPNPFNTNFTLKISSEVMIENTVMEIYDVCGKKVKKVYITNNETVIERDDLKNGIYFYQVINNNSTIFKGKLVVQ